MPDNMLAALSNQITPDTTKRQVYTILLKTAGINKSLIKFLDENDSHTQRQEKQHELENLIKENTYVGTELLQYLVNTTFTEASEYHVLHWAVTTNQGHVLKMVLDRLVGLDLKIHDITTSTGLTALHCAAMAGVGSGIVQMLLNVPGWEHAITREVESPSRLAPDTPLTLATRFGETKVTKMLKQYIEVMKTRALGLHLANQLVIYVNLYVQGQFESAQEQQREQTGFPCGCPSIRYNLVKCRRKARIPGLFVV